MYYEHLTPVKYGLDTAKNEPHAVESVFVIFVTKFESIRRPCVCKWCLWFSWRSSIQYQPFKSFKWFNRSNFSNRSTRSHLKLSEHQLLVEWSDRVCFWWFLRVSFFLFVFPFSESHFLMAQIVAWSWLCVKRAAIVRWKYKQLLLSNYIN